MSSYDLPQTQAELRSTFALVRLQIVSPLSLLVSIGANLVCSLFIKPSMADISRSHPTLVTPLSLFIGGYWLVVYALQIGLCLILIMARSEETKDTLIRGIGIRFSIANWLMAGWAVFFTMQFSWSFLVAEVLLLLNVLNLASIYLTLHWHAHSHKPLDWIFIHVPMRLMLVVIWSVDIIDNGFIVLGWEARDEARYAKYALQACASIAVVNVVGLLIVFFKRDLVWAISATYLLVALLLKRPKPTTVVATIIIFLALYPLVYLSALALHRIRTRDGRIRLEEDAILARTEEDQRLAIAGGASNHHSSAPPAGGAAAA
ncbi:hypothetical protein BDY24DRAFT_266155 [Mrakia frigida]|uniref:uncharacterized protein n=1 Tax=Mrakia frigida TaxID=29902 RepID=UPI003FCC1D70